MEKWEQDLESIFADPEYSFAGLTPSEVEAIKEAFHEVFRLFPLEIGALGVQFPELLPRIFTDIFTSLQADKFLEVIELYRVAGQSENWVFELTVNSLLVALGQKSAQAGRLN